MDKDINIKISVIIVTYNGYKYIAQAIDSVLSQTYRDIELIVVDDGSTDIKLMEVLSVYISNNLIKYLYKKNGGQGSARNEGVKMSQGKYIAFLDDDDYWVKDKLDKQIKLIEKSNSILCYSDSFMLNLDNVILDRTIKGLSNFYDGFVLNKIIFNNFITLSSVLIKRDFLLELLFNESDYMRRIEDYDLWLRLSNLGNFCYVDEPLVYYRTKLPLNNKNKIDNYKRILKMFSGYIIKSDIKYKIYYILGWLFYFNKFVFFYIKNIYE